MFPLIKGFRSCRSAFGYSGFHSIQQRQAAQPQGAIRSTADLHLYRILSGPIRVGVRTSLPEGIELGGSVE